MEAGISLCDCVGWTAGLGCATPAGRDKAGVCAWDNAGQL